jgi:hypothetical protein
LINAGHRHATFQAGNSAFFTHSHKIKRRCNTPLTLRATATGSNADPQGSRIRNFKERPMKSMRAHPVITVVAVILAGVGLKVIFFAAPTAEADSRPIKSVGVDISQMHQNIKSLPTQKILDMSLVFPVSD